MSLFSQTPNVITHRRPARQLEAAPVNAPQITGEAIPSDQSKTVRAPRQILHLRHTAPPDTSAPKGPAR